MICSPHLQCTVCVCVQSLTAIPDSWGCDCLGYRFSVCLFDELFICFQTSNACALVSVCLFSFIVVYNNKYYVLSHSVALVSIRVHCAFTHIRLHVRRSLLFLFLPVYTPNLWSIVSSLCPRSSPPAIFLLYCWFPTIAVSVCTSVPTFVATSVLTVLCYCVSLFCVKQFSKFTLYKRRTY